MKRIAGLILLLILLTLPFSADAQRWKLRRYEGSFGLSATSLFCDVGASSQNPLLGLKTIMIGSTRPSFAVGARYKLSGDMALKLNLNYGFLNGTDGGDLSDIGREYSLNLTIFEPSVQFEYYLLAEGRSFSTAALFNRRGMLNNYSKVYLYLFGGAGGAFFWQGSYEGVDTHPTGFVGFQSSALVFPAGIGLKYSIDSKWSIGFEYGRRFTLTDKIDGLVTPTSERNDIYDFATFSAIYKVRTDRRGRPVFGGGYGRR